MEREHEIIEMVYAAKEDSEAADRLIAKYLPFIKAQTAKFTRVIPSPDRDDRLSIAMFAFHEAALSYERGKGSFLALAATAIRNRLIDYGRREKRHERVISLDMPEDGEDGRALIDSLDSGTEAVHEYLDRSAAKAEILHFTEELKRFGLSLADIADNCPKQERTLEACHRALAYAKAHPELLDRLTETGRLPLAALVKGAGADRKTLERHRRYLVAILLAYTNGFEIIRGHLRQVAPREGGSVK